MTLPLLFVSGAGLPSWIWEEVRAGLSGPSAVAARPSAGVGTVTEYAQAALDAAPDGPFGVVAHSSGGAIATELVRLSAGRVTTVLGLAAVIPRAGASFASSLPFPNRAVLPLVLRLAGTRPPDSAIRKGMAAGLSERTVMRLISDFEPEPLKYFITRTNGLEAMQAVPIKKYVVTTKDLELSTGMQRRFAQQLGANSVSDVASGHLPMLTRPDVVLGLERSLRDSEPAV